MRTFGEHKGYGLAVVCELLGGALTGGGPGTPDEGSKRRMLERHAHHPHRPEAARHGDVFARETTAYLDSLRKSPPAPGFDRVRIAGEPERETRAERDGIPVDAETWRESSWPHRVSAWRRTRRGARAGRNGRWGAAACEIIPGRRGSLPHGPAISLCRRR